MEDPQNVSSLITKLQTLPPLSSDSPGNEISLYDGDPIATAVEVTNQVNRLKVAFANQAPEFWVLMMEIIRDENMPITRLKDAVLDTIKNRHYPNLTIADILSYDKKYKLYTHPQVCQMISDGYTWDQFETVKQGDVTRWRIKTI